MNLFLILKEFWNDFHMNFGKFLTSNVWNFSSKTMIQNVGAIIEEFEINEQ